MKTITVFTTTYNRAYLLPRLYESLCNQTNLDFLWLVVDDGSTDETEGLVLKWINEGKINIEYHYKENGGMHTGHNYAYSLIETEYNVCIDSDDYLLNNSIATYLHLIDKHEISNNEELAGIIGLNITPSGNVIGSKFPKNKIKCSYQDISYKHKAVGDKKIVFKTKYIKKIKPYPEFGNEKFVPLYYPIVLDGSYKYLCFNENFCIVEYQDDGSTINIFKQYFNNPQGFRYSRGIEMVYYQGYKRKFKSAVHLVSSNLILKEFNWFKGSPNKLLTFFAIPFGVIWYFNVKSKLNSKRDISSYIR